MTALLALCIGAVYGRSLNVPFIFDDRTAITENESILSLWPLVGTPTHRGPLNPAPDLPTTSRPLVNLSFALNYHFGGLNPIGYHAVNVGIHFLSSLLLWAIVRRTLLLPYFAGRFATSAAWLALAVALLWALHPLQTETVIYATQRSELLVALFYLATHYCSLRYWEGQTTHSRTRTWLALAVVACLSGMASKEVMASAPLMVLLFERTFIAGSLPNALRRSWPLYAGLLASCLLLLITHVGVQPSSSAGFGLGVPAHAWWLTQAKVLLIYLKLVVWPHPLLIHYEFPYLSTFAESWMYLIPVLLLGVATLVLLWRNRPVGYLGTWVFAILAPTIVIPIITEMAAERRMYLPLAAIIVLLVIGAYQLAEWASSRLASQQKLTIVPRPRLAPLGASVVLLAVVFALVSAKRLAAYKDEMQLWQEVLQSQPQDYMAHTTVGLLLKRSDRLPEALREFQIARDLKPDYDVAHNNLGIMYLRQNNLSEAITELQAAVKMNPDFTDALNNLGLALTRTNRYPEAISHLEHAIQLKPDYAGAHENLGIAFAGVGKFPQAVEQFQRALDLGQNDADTHNYLGITLIQVGSTQQAIQHFEQAIQLQPDRPDIQTNLGDALRQSNQPQLAVQHYQAALRAHPEFLPAYVNLTATLATANQSQEAIAIAKKGIEVARNTGQSAAAEKLEEWLSLYQTELQRAAVESPSK